MRVKMLVSISGTINGQDWPVRGGEIDVPAQVADDLIVNKYAEAVGAAPTVETAAADPVVETAAKPAGRPRKTTKG
jgi:hypothetical protein